MDRLIKFRGKSIETGKWVYGDLIHMYLQNPTIQELKPARGGVATYITGKVDPGTVGQFTGFKDIGGDDIYEGDIIQNNAHPELFYEVAMLGDGYWSGVLVNDEDENPSLAWLLETAPFVIIGNVHDKEGSNDD